MQSLPYLGCIDKPNTHVDITQLQELTQWVVWKYELRNGQWKKPPYNPHTGNLASSTNQHTWCTYQLAQEKLTTNAPQTYDGVGFVFSKDDPFCGIDLDHCRDPKSGTIQEWAQEIISTLSSYTEISPSGEGIHIIIKGKHPGTQHKSTTGTVEIYDKERYFTFSGNHLPGTPTTIERRQAELDTIYASLFPKPQEVLHVGGEGLGDYAKAAPLTLDLSDEQIVQVARKGSRGKQFTELFDHGTSSFIKESGNTDASKADLALCGILAFYTRRDAGRMDRLFRQSALMRSKWNEKRGNSTYGERTIEKAIQNCRSDYDPTYGLTPSNNGTTKKKRRAQHITHVPQVQSAKQEETIEERQALLERLRNQMRDVVEGHITAKAKEILVVLSPPGVGKSHTIAELGEHTTVDPTGKIDMAWISERRGSVVPALDHFQHIQPCTKHNCDSPTLHNIIAQLGYNTWSIHKDHLLPCEYTIQFRQRGSTKFQLQHVPTSYPAKHEAIVIDEFDPPKWLPEREITVSMLHSALASASVKSGSSAEELLLYFQAVLVDAQRSKKQLHGKSVFDALDAKTHGKLEGLLIELRNIKEYENTRPWANIEIESNDAEEQALRLPYVVLPHLLNALDSEFFKWRKGTPWNSQIRIGPGKSGGWSFFITTPLSFNGNGTTLPPLVILDATADEELLGLLFGNKITIHREIVTPAPGTKHIAIRTGKRYGKYTLTNKKKATQPDLARAIAECKYFLNQVDPEGLLATGGKVGLITYAACEEQMRVALGIPEGKSGHFWAMRGSNVLEKCEILLVVGTPTLRPTEIARLARALWRHDQTPIDETSESDPQTKAKVYKDERMRRLNEYLTRAELTQCAHRVRPLKNANRTIITFCLGDIDYLPPTQTYTQLPSLTPEGLDKSLVKQEQDTQKLEAACKKLEAAGTPLSVRTLKAEAHVSTDTASSYRRERLVAQACTPQTCATPGSIHVPDMPNESISCEGRNSDSEEGASASLPTFIPACEFCHSTRWRRRIDGRFVCSVCFVGPPLSWSEQHLYFSSLQS